MASVTFSLDTSDWQRAIRTMRAKAPARIATALNRSATSTRAVMSREVSRDMGIKVGVAKNAMTIEKASGSRLRAFVRALGARLPLIAFGAKGPEPSRGQGRGVTARMQGGRKRYPHAFIATMSSGHRGVFSRQPDTRGPRLPIRELKGPSIPHVFHKFAPIGMERGNESLVKNLQHEFPRLLQSLRG